MNPSLISDSKPSKRQGLTKCWIVWKNGWKKTFQSYDKSGRYEVNDSREYGIRGLKKMVARWGDFIAQAIIYDNATGQAIESFKQGVWVQNVKC